MVRIDVSMPLFAGMPSFPGDPEYSITPDRSIARGDAYNVSRLVLGTHAGTHVDPPCHFLPGAPAIDAIDLGALNGRCHVVTVDEEAREVGPADVDAIPPGTERVLFRTANSARWQHELRFFPDYVALAPSAARALAARGLRLVGIDALSVESDPSGSFPVHHALLGSGALILEGLLLGSVAPGAYELACLPLRLRGGDGGPARALLTSR
ncbi:MAG TPA: cyclase family protein [Thermoplasmata archaeon]|nr:cyclase family protein [Thermoplasmata archaeon]